MASLDFYWLDLIKKLTPLGYEGCIGTRDVAQVRPELDRRAQYVIDLLTNPITVIIIIYLILLICTVNRHYGTDRVPVRVAIVLVGALGGALAPLCPII